MKLKIRKSLNITFSILLAGAILYWMYRDLDIETLSSVLKTQVDWWWMLASLPFGVLAQMFRGWRWKQSLAATGEHPGTATTIHSIFISYAASLIVPRIGEFTRCGILAKKEGVSFPKALGTVVTERVIDSLIVLVITTLVLLMQMPVFVDFFSRTGTRLDDVMNFVTQFSAAGYVVTSVCVVSILAVLIIFHKRIAFLGRVKTTMQGVKEGIMSLKHIENIPLFIFYSIAIWASYFLHYYLTFFCFEATSSLSLTTALVTFIVGSIAVLVPTPNGAGSWHFAVKTMLLLYGVAEVPALYFVLVVHTIQTLLVMLLGLYGWVYTFYNKE